MDRLGIQSLNAGAPDLRLSGDQTQRGTYTQRRRTQMAGGGITQIGKPGGLVEPGISKYGMLDFITKPLGKLKDKIVDDIIPNEIKNPAALATLTGIGLNQFGLPIRIGGLEKGAGQNWIGELLGNVVPGGTIDMVLGQGGSGQTLGTGIGNIWDAITGTPTEYSTTRPGETSGIEKIAQDMAQGTTGAWDIGQWGPNVASQVASNVPYMDRIMDIAQNRTPQGIKDAAFQYAKDVAGKNKYLDYAKNFGKTFLGDTTRGDETFNWKIPVAGGLAAGAYTASQPRDVLPMDETGINFQTAAEAMADKDLRFKPEAQYANVAEGGRIGYDSGGVSSIFGNPDRSEYEEFMKNIYENVRAFENDLEKRLMNEYDLDRNTARRYASTINFYVNSNPLMLSGKEKKLEEGYLGKNEIILKELENEDNRKAFSGFAQGGRIGYERGRVVRPGGYSGVIDRNIANLTAALETATTDEERAEIQALLDKQIEAKGGVRDKLLSGDPVPETEDEGSFWDFLPFVGKAQGGRIGYDNGGDVDDVLFNQATVWDLFESETGRFPENDDELRAWIKSKSHLERDTIRQAQFAERPGPPPKYKPFPKYMDWKTGPVVSEQYKNYLDRMGEYVSAHGGIGGAAQGGRIGAQEGGLMDLGGMEKDYREEGGFVPIGGREKADDVPARLSKNEFVFTADAVRNAGGGDIDEGAAVMERLMDNLEAGGKVSEDSQGLEGAQEMFANTQRLQNRII